MTKCALGFRGKEHAFTARFLNQNFIAIQIVTIHQLCTLFQFMRFSYCDHEVTLNE